MNPAPIRVDVNITWRWGHKEIPCQSTRAQNLFTQTLFDIFGRWPSSN